MMLVLIQASASVQAITMSPNLTLNRGLQCSLLAFLSAMQPASLYVGVAFSET